MHTPYCSRCAATQALASARGWLRTAAERPAGTAAYYRAIDAARIMIAHARYHLTGGR